MLVFLRYVDLTDWLTDSLPCLIVEFDKIRFIKQNWNQKQLAEPTTRKFCGGMEFPKKLPGLAPFCGQMLCVKYRDQDIDKQLELEKKIFLYKRKAIGESKMTALFMDTAAIKELQRLMCNLEEIDHRLDQKLDSSMSRQDQLMYLRSFPDDMPKYLETFSPSYKSTRLPAKKTGSTVYLPVKKGKTKLQEKPEMKDKHKQNIERAARRPVMAEKQDIGTASRKPEMEEEKNSETASMADSARIDSFAEMVPSPRKAAERGLVAGLEGKMTTVESELKQLKGGQKMNTFETEFAGAQGLLLPPLRSVSTSAPSQSESMECNMATMAMLSAEKSLSGRSLSAHESSTFDVASETTEVDEAGDHCRSGPSLMPTLPAIASSSNPSKEIELVEDNISKVSAELVEYRDDIQSSLETNPIHAPELAPGSVPVPKTAETTKEGESSLSFEKAWHLFHQLVGEVIDNPDVHPYARGIVEQCSGLKLLIILTGKALAEEKDITVWESTFKYFLSPIKDGKSGTLKLKFIYNRSMTRGTKKLSKWTCDLQGCFLYCALFPQDYQVNISTLVEYWIHEGLIAGNAENVCKIGRKIVKILVDTALLESVGDGHCIKMNRMIREFALELVLQEVEARRLLGTTNFSLMQLPRPAISPSSKPLGVNVSKAGAGKMEPPSEEKWEHAKMIFLMDNELSSLPEKLKCHNLVALFLQRNQCLREIPISFFDCMPSLQVLNLSETGITSLPKSVSKLKSLKELMIRDCEHFVKLPSELGELQRLELLDLHGTEIDKLPIKTGQLASLKYMKISFYGPVDPTEYSKLPPKLFSKRIISRLLSLKILGIIVTPGDPRWNKIAECVTRDISKLSNITDLHFYFPQEEPLDIFVKISPSWRGNNLKNFNFVVGHDVKRMISRVPHNMKREYNQRGQCMRFVNGETIPRAVLEVLS